MPKLFVIGAAVVIVLAIAAITLLPLFVDTPVVRAYVLHAASHALGRPVTYASLSVSAFPLPSLRLKGLQVAEDPAFGPGPFLAVREGVIGIRLGPLLGGRVELSDLTLRHPQITLIEDAAGRLNLATLGGSTSTALAPSRSAGGKTGSGAQNALLFSSIRVVDGSLRYNRSGSKDAALQLDRVNVTVSQPAPGDALQLSGDAVGQPGDVRLVLRDASLVPATARTAGDMRLKATVDVDAADVAPLGNAVMVSPAVSGPVKGTIELTGTLGRVTAAGALALDRATLSDIRPQCGEPVRRELVLEAVRLPLTASPAGLESSAIAARVARGVVSLRLQVSLPAPASATFGDISIKGVELRPVLVDFLCQPYAVTGPLDLSGQMTLRLGDGWRSAAGAGRMRVGPGKVVGRAIVNLVREVVGLGTSVAALVRPDRPLPSPLEFDSITATYTIKDGVARTDDLFYRSRDVAVRGAGTYDLADGRVAMEVTLSEGANRVKGFVSGAPGSLRVVPAGAKFESAREIKKFLDQLFR